MHATAKTTSFQCEKQRLDHPAKVTAITEDSLSPFCDTLLSLDFSMFHILHGKDSDCAYISAHTACVCVCIWEVKEEGEK